MSQVTPTVVDKGDRQVSRSIVVNAPVEDLFAMVVNPHRHYELDGSGTVRDQAKGPVRLSEGDTFVVHMKMFGIPYTITSTATQIEQDRVVEWKHPGGHHWRYEFESLAPARTRVTETFDYRASKAAKVLEMLGVPGKNAAGIESTLVKLAREHA
jgi:uncharacterized protein YndB with AHSA1/START domain